MAGRHGTQDGQSPATISTTKSKLGGSVPAPSHLATSLSNHDNNQLGGERHPRVSSKYFFLFVLLSLVCFKHKNKIYSYSYSSKIENKRVCLVCFNFF
jgi:hypothetical protein